MGVSVEETPIVDNDGFSDDDVSEVAHKNLLNAVSQLYKKQRIEAPKRREATQEISEFHLSSYDEARKNKVNVNELLGDLNEKVTHKEINKKVKNAQKKAKTLPEPLEKNEADKIHRTLGYENVKKKLNKWNTIVERNRMASQLSFPLQQKPMQKEPPNFLTTFEKPSELEMAMAAVLNKSEAAQEERKLEDDLSKLSIEEMIERRNTMARMKARESYRATKAARQNKIKSKRYHRILKKERIKQELANFEKLKQTDPEAALEKLEQLERARAEERISLRHRNTGKWAKSRAIRAKYDSEARIQLAEQLAKSRELTRKIRANESSSSESELEDQDNAKEEVNMHPPSGTKNPSSNPWVNEFESFLKGFTTFAKESKGEEAQLELPASGKCESSLPGPQTTPAEVSPELPLPAEETNDLVSRQSPSKNCSTNQPVSNASPSKKKQLKDVTENNDVSDVVNDSVKANDSLLDHNESNPNDPTTSIVDSSGLKKNASLTDLSVVNKSSTMPSPLKHTVISTEIVSPLKDNVCSKKKKQALSPKKSLPKNITNSSTPSGVSVNRSLAGEGDKAGIPASCLQIHSSSDRTTQRKRKSKPKTVVTNSGAWDVVECVPASRNEILKRKRDKKNIKEKSFEEIFDEAEEVVQNHLANSVMKMKAELQNELKETESHGKKDNYEKTAKAPFRRSGIDEALIEIHEDGLSSGVNDVKLLKDKLTGTQVAQEPQIDPNKHISVKTQKLLAEVDDTDEGEEDSDEDGTTQRMHLMEAFADDDIADEFRKEKDEESKKDKQEEINLEMPGWGSWGGTNVVQKSKRRKRRLMVKLQNIPRKDANRPTVIINEDPIPKLRSQLVNELPYPFTSVKDYEASIRAPIGKHWVPEQAYKKLTAPPVLTKMGTIIEPMSDDIAVTKKRRKFSD